MIKLNGNGEKGVLTRKIDIKSLIINLQRYSIENNLVCMYLIWAKFCPQFTLITWLFINKKTHC